MYRIVTRLGYIAIIALYNFIFSVKGIIDYIYYKTTPIKELPTPVDRNVTKSAFTMISRPNRVNTKEGSRSILYPS